MCPVHRLTLIISFSCLVLISCVSSGQLLHTAVWENDPQLVSSLLSSGADANAVFSGGFTPLHTAASKNRKEIAEMLLSNGADVCAITRTHFTPLHLAATTGASEVAELLIAYGADVDVTAKEGVSPLQLHLLSVIQLSPEYCPL